MKLICVDKTAADRIRLQRLIEEAFTACRDTVGHLLHLEIKPVTREELLFSGPGSGIVLVGSGYSIDEIAGVCSSIQEQFRGTPIFACLPPEALSLRTLRRFERYSAEVFSTEESSMRIVHSLLRQSQRRVEAKRGKLTVMLGVKGGVGATSIAAGLAHAADSIGLRAVLHDLSPHSVVAQYLGAPRSSSADYRVLLTDRVQPARHVVERCIVRCPNGLHLLLPPAGSAEIRETWLRDPGSLDISLGVFEILCELYDLVLVDLAGAEGVLPFSLLARADVRALVSSNEPGSVHLLNDRLAEVAILPATGQTKIIVNLLQERSLTQRDVESFLLQTEVFDRSKMDLCSLSADRRATSWVGTGNTLYTEGRRTLQRQLDELLLTIAGRPALSEPRHALSTRLTSLLRRPHKNPGRREALPPPPFVSAPFEEPNFVLSGKCTAPAAG